MKNLILLFNCFIFLALSLHAQEGESFWIVDQDTVERTTYKANGKFILERRGEVISGRLVSRTIEIGTEGYILIAMLWKKDSTYTKSTVFFTVDSTITSEKLNNPQSVLHNFNKGDTLISKSPFVQLRPELFNDPGAYLGGIGFSGDIYDIKTGASMIMTTVLGVLTEDFSTGSQRLSYIAKVKIIDIKN
ncbi:hypothetical protein COB64_04460 [Candidatus Wolfebacteria bacterium]|nr:MAG: hypothetical protein COB64_04460 [Candidatus Wolfebacteria bacterium]